MTALKLKIKQADKPLLANLVIDETAIRKQVEWNGSRFTGFVYVSGHIDSDELPEAREVLAFMLVCLNDRWKIPVGYFLANGIGASEKANLVNKCLEFLHESKIVVTSLTFDGAASNVSMIKKLGANVSNFNNIKSYFKHPVTQEKVFILYDPCHMIKLVRNCFASMKVLKNGSNELINWEFISKLVDR